jgi:hypothetical protein
MGTFNRDAIDRLPTEGNGKMLETVTREEWRRAHAQGYANIWDGRRYMLRINKETGTTVWREIEIADEARS